MEVDPEPYLGQLDDFVGMDHKVFMSSFNCRDIRALSIYLPLYFRESPAPFPDPNVRADPRADPAGACSGVA